MVEFIVVSLLNTVAFVYEFVVARDREEAAAKFDPFSNCIEVRLAEYQDGDSKVLRHFCVDLIKSSGY